MYPIFQVNKYKDFVCVLDNIPLSFILQIEEKINSSDNKKWQI